MDEIADEDFDVGCWKLSIISIPILFYVNYQEKNTMENDTMFRQTVLNSPRSLRFSATLKGIAYLNGAKKSGKKKQTKSQHEQAAEVQNSILLWNLIYLTRKGLLTKM